MKCENCLKQDVCLFLSKSANFLGKKQALTENVDCCRFEDKSQWVKLPCKVGDVVYKITKRADTKTNYITKAIITINNALYYKKLYEDNECYLSLSEAQAELERLKERE